jgi:hypothetical protein
MVPFFIHLGYLITLAGFLVRDILWLRSLLAVAQLCLLTASLHAGTANALNSAFWQGTFMLINIGWSIKIARERRPIALPDDLRITHEKVFPSLSPREFLYVWTMGRKAEARDQLLIREGEAQRDLCLLTDGEVVVSRQGREVARLGPGRFVAEMSFLTGEPASADVSAAAPVQYMAWDQEKLRNLQLLNAPLYMKLQGILGTELSSKMRATTARAGG